MTRRILLLITDLEIGGTPTVVRELAVRLHAPPGVVVEVCCLRGFGPVALELRAMGIAVTSLGVTSSLQFPQAVWRLVRVIRDGPIRAPDSGDGLTPSPLYSGERAGVRGRTSGTVVGATTSVHAPPFTPTLSPGYRGAGVPGKEVTVFSFLVHANAVAAAARPFCPADVRFIQSIQTSQPSPAWHWRVQAWSAGGAERIVVPSPSVARVAQERSHIAAGRIEVIPNAIDAAAMPPSPVPADDPRPYPIAFIGRLDPVKRLPDLIEAVRLLDGLVRLDIWGEGDERDRIERIVQQASLWSHVTLHGAIARPHEALQQAGMLVLPSEAEGFGLVLIEAMAAGVPVVATEVPGIRDVVRHDQNGLLVPPGDPPALAAAIRRIVEDRTLRMRLTGAGLLDVQARFAWDTVLPKYRRLLGI